MFTFLGMECVRRFRTARAEERAASDGCPGCGGVDIDIDTTSPTPTRPRRWYVYRAPERSYLGPVWAPSQVQAAGLAQRKYGHKAGPGGLVVSDQPPDNPPPAARKECQP